MARVRTHKKIFSIHREVNRSKYNKVTVAAPIKDIREEYEIREDGWRRKEK